MNKELIKLIQSWKDLKKTGKITINFFKGGVLSVNKEETIRLTEDSKVSYEKR